MAVFTDPKAFVANIGKYGTKIAQVEEKAVQAAALAATRDIRGEAGRFHIGTKRLGVGYTMAGKSAVIQARGPWGIVEKGSKPHAIYPKKRGRGQRRSVVSVPGRGVFAHVSHPGHRSLGKPWEEGLAKARKSGPEAFNRKVLEVFR